jgi:hypothetical protein
MIKVRITRGMTTGLVALSTSLAACSVANEEGDLVESSEAAITQQTIESIAGTGQFALHGWSLNYQSTSGGDEFIRVTEKMRMKIDYQYFVMLLQGQEPTIDAILAGDPQKLSAKVKLTYTKFDDTKQTVELAKATWKTTNGIVTGDSPQFAIPKGVKRVKVEVVAEYVKDGAKKSVLAIGSQGIPNEFTVFGAYLPNKLALFDTVGGTKRTRVVEGNGIVKGSGLTLTLTDWRLDTVVDKSTLDLRYGRQNNYSRFGTNIVDAIGQLEYVVSAAYSTDGGATWQGVDFQKVMKADVFAQTESWRFAFQKFIGIPANAKGVKVAFHVQAYLQVPNYYPGQVFDARYAPGSRILLKDVWDNNDGKDYSLPIAD